ncbi:MAG: MltA domain-containing protein [Planctomycetota bacterium]
MRSLRVLWWLTVPGLVLCVGCHKPAEEVAITPQPDYAAPLPPGELALRRITDPNRIPDFSPGFIFRTRLRDAVDRSLNYMSKPSSHSYFPYGDITHERAVASLKAFREVLDQARSGEELNDRVRQRFDVYESVGYNGEGIVWFTGYYRPIFDARLKQDAEFKYPLYGLPDDLVKDPEGNCIGRRQAEGSTTPRYYDRREIETSRLLAGKEIAWLRDPFEAYIVTVQGSGKMRLEDGTYYEIGYAANNGYDYVPVGPKLVEDGKIPSNELSLKRMIDFFKLYPNEITYYTHMNPRYVFFMPRTGGPFGSLNEPVTPYRTIATDKDVYPRACVAFVKNILPGREAGTIVQKRYEAFALDQDTGGAIRAPGRCDIFLGTGDTQGELAGRTTIEGRLYYIFVKQ